MSVRQKINEVWCVWLFPFYKTKIIIIEITNLLFLPFCRSHLTALLSLAAAASPSENTKHTHTLTLLHMGRRQIIRWNKRNKNDRNREKAKKKVDWKKKMKWCFLKKVVVLVAHRYYNCIYVCLYSVQKMLYSL